MDSKWSKVIIHASAFLPTTALILIPILFFLVSVEDEVKRLAMQALLFQVVMWVLISISAFLSVFIIGIPFLIVFSVMLVIVPIIGIVNALSERPWNYPIVGRWL